MAGSTWPGDPSSPVCSGAPQPYQQATPEGVFLARALRFSLRRRRLSASSSGARVRGAAAAAAASCRPRYTSPRVGAAGPTPSAGGDGEGDGALGEATRARVEREREAVAVVDGWCLVGWRAPAPGICEKGEEERAEWSGEAEGNLGFGLRELCAYTCVGGSIVVALGLYPMLLLRPVPGAMMETT